MTIPKVKSTNRKLTGEFDETALPVFVGGPADEFDGRVQLPDGSPAFAIDDGRGETGLYRQALAMDAGDNIRRRFLASERGLGGITAPTGPNGTGLSGQRGQLQLVGDEQVGWLL